MPNYKINFISVDELTSTDNFRPEQKLNLSAGYMISSDIAHLLIIFETVSYEADDESKKRTLSLRLLMEFFIDGLSTFSSGEFIELPQQTYDALLTVVLATARGILLGHFHGTPHDGMSLPEVDTAPLMPTSLKIAKPKTPVAEPVEEI